MNVMWISKLRGQEGKSKQRGVNMSEGLPYRKPHVPRGETGDLDHLVWLKRGQLEIFQVCELQKKPPSRGRWMII